MNVEQRIDAYIAGQPAPKRADLQALHDRIVRLMPSARLWFLDGRNAEGKIVTNPNIGYGVRTIGYADGGEREFYRVGISANTTGISVYIMGMDDKTYLSRTYGDALGKASVTGYCIKFRKLADVDPGVLESAIDYGLRKD